MKIVRGEKLEELGSAELEILLAAHSALWLDIGSGDGDFVYRQARENPRVLCLGLEPAWKNMSRVSNRALRRKTAAPNALFVQGAIESPPAELSGRADAVSINYPWSGLLRALALPDTAILKNIRSMAKTGAAISIYITLHVFQDEGVKGAMALPAFDAEYVRSELLPVYQRQKLAIESFEVCREKLPVKTAWGSRLSLNSRRSSCLLLLRAV